MKKFIFVASLVLTITVFAQSGKAGGGSSIGPANPATLNCQKLKGVSKIVETPEGQAGYCLVEEWYLYKKMSMYKLVKTNGIGSGGANPASVNCLSIGGRTKIIETSQGQAGYCFIDEWKLMKAINISAFEKK